MHTALKQVAASSSVAAPATLVGAATLSVPVRRIATFHSNSLSEMVFSLPALLALRESFPGATICAIARPGLASLLECSSLVDEVMTRPKGGLSSQAALMAKLHARHFDMALAFAQSRNSLLLLWSTGAPTRVGFVPSKLDALLTHRVECSGPTSILAYLELARSIGCRAHCQDPAGLLLPSPEAEREAAGLLKENGVLEPFLVAAPEARPTANIREWPLNHWVAAFEQLAPRWPIVLTGTRPVRGLGSRLPASLAGRIFDLGGRMDLPVLAALLARSSLFMGIDGGALHLAAAMKVPVVGLFGPTDWRARDPRGAPSHIVRHPVECSPCELAQCKWSGAEERKCLTRIEPDQLVRAVQELIGV